MTQVIPDPRNLEAPSDEEISKGVLALSLSGQTGSILVYASDIIAFVKQVRDRTAAAERTKEELSELPCCPVHENLLKSGGVKPFENCIVCTRNERDELEELILSLREWKSPDGVLQVKNLHWFKELESTHAR